MSVEPHLMAAGLFLLELRIQRQDQGALGTLNMEAERSHWSQWANDVEKLRMRGTQRGLNMKSLESTGKGCRKIADYKATLEWWKGFKVFRNF